MYEFVIESIAIPRNVEILEPLERIGKCTVYADVALTPDDVVERFKGADGVVGGGIKITADIMDRCPKLRCISVQATGAEKYVELEEAARRGVAVTNTPGYAGEAVAEHALALMLAVARHVVNGDRDLRAGIWPWSYEGKELAGKTLGICGLGVIGSRVAQLGSLIGMRVLGYDPLVRPDEDRLRDVTFVDLPTLFRESDFVTLHQACVPENHRMISRELLSLMKEDAILVNTARAELVDMQALTEVLDAGRIYGAGLDVYDEEPVTNFDSKLFRLDNVVLTPHIAYDTVEANLKLAKLAVNNLAAYFTGNPTNVVNAPLARRF
jgi:phosphoglycerate dehydrogenase-like enzyme